MKKTKAALKAQKMMRADQFMNFVTGMSVRGRDKKEGAIFVPERRFSSSELDAMYRFDGITRSIVDIFSNEMIREGWEIEGEKGAEVLSKLEELKVAENMSMLIKWARLYGGAICVMGIEDGFYHEEDYLRHLAEPVNEKTIRNVKWLHVFDRWQVQVFADEYEGYLGSTNYGQPITYTVTDERTSLQFNVHHSRVLRMDWGTLPARRVMENQGWGDSVIQILYRDIKNYGCTLGNMATIMENFVQTVLSVPNISELQDSECASQLLLRRLDQFALTLSNINMGIVDGEEKFEKHSTSVSGIPEILDRFMMALSAASRIPAALLFGRSVAGLNATGDHDLRTFYDAVKREQEFRLRPCLEKLIRYIMLAKEGPTSGIEPEDWSLQFCPLWQLDESEEAQVRKSVAETDAIYLANGVLSAQEVAESRFGSGRWSMDTRIDKTMRDLEQEIGEEDEDPELIDIYSKRLAE